MEQVHRGFYDYREQKLSHRCRYLLAKPTPTGNPTALHPEVSFVFQAGTKIDAENNLVTNGGRVLTATSQGNSIKEAVEKSKNILSQINFDGMYYREDIGYEFE